MGINIDNQDTIFSADTIDNNDANSSSRKCNELTTSLLSTTEITDAIIDTQTPTQEISKNSEIETVDIPTISRRMLKNYNVY